MAGKFVFDERTRRLALLAREAQSVEELAQVCVEMDVADVINLGRMDLWLAKHALTAVYCTLRKFPKVRPFLNYFGILTYFEQNKQQIYASRAGGDALLMQFTMQTTDDFCRIAHETFDNGGLGMAFYAGEAGAAFSGILVNGRTFGRNHILNYLELAERVGQNPKGCKSVKAVIDHELGHILDYALDLCNCIEYKRWIHKFDEETMASELSKYSTYGGGVNEREVIAEGYAEYCNNPNPRPIAAAIGNLIERKYRERYG